MYTTRPVNATSSTAARKVCRQTDGFNHDIGPAAIGQLREMLVQIVVGGVDGVRGAGLASGSELRVIQIQADDRCAAKRRAGYRTQSHASATEYRHRVARCHAPARRGMKADRKRLDQAQLLQA